MYSNEEVIKISELAGYRVGEILYLGTRVPAYNEIGSMIWTTVKPGDSLAAIALRELNCFTNFNAAVKLLLETNFLPIKTEYVCSDKAMPWFAEVRHQTKTEFAKGRTPEEAVLRAAYCILMNNVQSA